MNLQTIITSNFAILTGENPGAKKYSRSGNYARNLKAALWLIRKGYEPIRVKGVYSGNKENSFIVPKMNASDALEFCRNFGQECVLTEKGLLFQDNSVTPAVTKVSQRPADNYTFIPATGQYLVAEFN